MKYCLVIGDGMADAFQKKTPLSVAEKSMMNYLAQRGSCGLVRTIPEGAKACSEIATLSILGIPVEQKLCRAPLEALGRKLPFYPGDLAVRVNFITLSEAEAFSARTLIQFGTDPLSEKEGYGLAKALDPLFQKYGYQLFYSGMYRMHAIKKEGASGAKKHFPMAPQEFLGEEIRRYLPEEPEDARLLEEASNLLLAHPINKERKERGEQAANGIWLWGGGGMPLLPNFQDIHQKKGAMVAGVELLKGIGQAIGLTVLDVPGATGGVDTDYSAKAEAALSALEKWDFVLLHVEAPDIFGHRRDYFGKTQAIAQLDQKIMTPIVKTLRQRQEPFRLLMLSDHFTPVATGIHSDLPVPFFLYDSREGVKRQEEREKSPFVFLEMAAAQTGIFYASGKKLIQKFFGEKR